MASKTHLNKLIQLSNNEEAALANLNANVDILNDVIDDYVSRSGLVPTQLQEPLDLGNQRIINVGTPESDNDVVRYKDVKDALDELHSIEADLQDVENAVIRANNAASSADQSAGVATAAKVDAIDAKNDAVSAKNAAVQAKDDITTLLTVDYPEITTVSNNISDVQTVAGIASDVSAVSSIASDVADVADIVSDVSTVANVDSDVSTVAGIASDVTTVAGVSTAVQAVEDNLTAVQNAAQNATDAANSAELAHKWATSSTVVESGQYGASYYALRAANYMNGAESARDLARNWANKTDGTVADSEYSAKYYAEQAAAIVAVLGTVMTYKGSVASYADLPSSGNTTGDVWNVLDTGKNYAWTGSAWDDFGGAITVSIAACSDVSLTTPTTGDVLIYNSVSDKWENGAVDSLPSQTGQSGKFLTTDGTKASWVNAPTVDQTYSASSANAQSGVAVASAVSGKQDTLVSGTNIKTINNTSLLGSGNIEISGGSSSLSDIAVAGEGISFKKENNTIVNGSCTITDNIASNFSSSNYLTSSYKLEVGSGDTWEIATKIHTFSGAYGTAYILFGETEGNLAVGVYSSNLDFNIGNNNWFGNANWIDRTIQGDTDYWYKVSFNGTKYSLSRSTDGETFTEVAYITNSNPIGTTRIQLGKKGTGGTINAIITSMDLSETYVKVNGDIVWTPLGKTTEISSAGSVVNRATGTDAFGVGAEGSTVTATGYEAIAIASGSSSSGETKASATGAIAIGNYCEATGNYGIAISYSTKANGTNAIAIGQDAEATYANSICIGYATRSSGDKSVTIGHSLGGGHTSASSQAVTIGYSSSASSNSVAIGASCSSNGDSVAIGYNSGATNYGTCVGYQAKGNGAYSVALGYGSTVNSYSYYRSIAIGYNATVTVADAIQLGYGTNSTSKTLSVGFYDANTPVNYTLLNSDGTIPTARMYLEGVSDPTTATVGTVGRLYENTTSGDLFRCSSIDTTDPNTPVYTWVKLLDSSSGALTNISTGTKGLVVGSVTSGLNVNNSNTVSFGMNAKPIGSHVVLVGSDTVAQKTNNSSAPGVTCIGDKSVMRESGSAHIGAFGTNETAGTFSVSVSSDGTQANAHTYTMMDSSGHIPGPRIALRSAELPTTSTVGSIGQLYIDGTNQDAYICVSDQNSTYIWKKITA